MVSLNDVSKDYLDRFKGEVPVWSTPADLCRLGMEAMAAQQSVAGGSSSPATYMDKIVGVLHTISYTSSWELELESDERVRIHRGDISASVTEDLHVGQRVHVTVRVDVYELPGGVERREYTAIDVYPL